mmetsp:Transcript_66571/g.184321  ORF Transcript_66571/g.184321 Transcript_66571/m.184321 type:complete len:223 (+) Transcript_66571:1929-2597(+)
MEEGSHLRRADHHVPRCPLVLLVAIGLLPQATMGFRAAPLILQPRVQLAVDAIDVLTVHLHVARASQLDDEVRLVLQWVVVPPEHQLLLPVGALLAIVAAIHGHEVPAREAAHEVAYLGREQAHIVLAHVPSLLEDIVATLVKAVAEVLVALNPHCLEILLQEGVQVVKHPTAIATDLYVSRRPQLNHAVRSHEVHWVRRLEYYLLLPDLPHLPHIATVDDP